MDLWTGADLKLSYAWFHLGEMNRAVGPPNWTAHEVAQMATGTILDTGWQRRFYPHFDAFVSALRSAPEVIQCCFGVDGFVGRKNHVMTAWFDAIPADEQMRREHFKQQFEPHYKQFRALFLGEVRHVVEHRSGVAPVEVVVIGSYGVKYTGGPATPVPTSETPTLAKPELQWMVQTRPVQPPRWDDFTIAEQPLFQAAHEYLTAASELVRDARSIVANVHGAQCVSTPPN